MGKQVFFTAVEGSDLSGEATKEIQAMFPTIYDAKRAGIAMRGIGKAIYYGYGVVDTYHDGQVVIERSYYIGS